MSPITKMFKKFKGFKWIEKCKNVWEEIKKIIYISPYLDPNWELDFHIHTYEF